MKAVARAFGVVGLTLVLIVADAARTRAWDPWNNIIKPAGEAIIGGVKTVGNIVGGIVGAPFGGFLGSAAQPVIDSAEAAGRRIVGQLDEVMTRQIDKIEKIADKLLGEVDLLLEKRLVQFDAAIGERIKQVDGILGQRLDQVNRMVATSIAEVDGVIKARLDQLDEIAATRIGTLDILATKTALTLEQTLIRVIGAGCILAFVAAALWVLYRQLTDARARTPRVSLWDVIRSRWKTILVQEVAVAAVVVVLFGLVYVLPGSARRKADALVADQDAAYQRAIAALDFQQARFHAAMMQAINSSDSSHRAKFLKAELLRDLFTRPAMLTTVQGVNNAVLRINQIETLVDDTKPDHDVDVIKAFVLWQSGMTKSAETEAARLCAAALAAPGEANTFALRPLAMHYLLNYGVRPHPDERVETPPAAAELIAAFQKDTIGGKAITPLTYMFRYDALVRGMDASVMTAYAAMIEKHGELIAVARLPQQDPKVTARKAEAAKERTARARVVVEQWDRFVTQVQSDPVISGSPAAFAPFLMNDAVYLRAVWYLDDPDGSKSVALAQTAPSVGTAPRLEGIPEAMRRRLPRVRLGSLLAEALARNVHEYVSSEEFRRFRAHEEALDVFEQRQTSFVLALHQGGLDQAGAPSVVQAAAAEAAVAASNAQVWSERRPYAAVIADKLKTIGAPFWDASRWKPAQDALTLALGQRSLKLL